MNKWLSSAGWLLLKLSLTGVTILFFYSVYLDSVVTERFEENRYQAPALLYSRALQISDDKPLQQGQVLRELQALNYRHTRYAREPGEFNLRDNMILLHRRAFDFADGFEPSQRLRLRFEDEELAEILAWPTQQPLSVARLEPQLIGRFAADSGEDRLLVNLEQVPQLMQDTLLLVEDRDFYQHRGVKPSAILRAASANLAAGRTVQGGSTLTQQLIKNMYLTHDQNLRRKANEAIMALILDYRFSKNEILEAYFNEVYFGQDRGHAIHGVGLASQYFFGKSVEDLTPAEIALLVGMVKGPSLYDPRRRPQRASARRDLVLRLMYENDLINQPQYLAAIEAPLVGRESTRLVVRDRPDYVDLVQRELRQLVPGKEWQQTGLRVFTHYDPYLQEYAEEALQRGVVSLQVADIEGAVVVADHQQGVVRALAGSIHPSQAGFNRALTARRPVGSLIKPFTYALALEQPERYELNTLLDDSAIVVTDERDREWQPGNFDGEFRGDVTLYESLVDSRNLPAIRVGLDLGVEKVRERLYNSGLDEPTHAYPSLLLGAVDMSPLAVTQLYSVLANQGGQQRLTSIQTVTTHWGHPLYRAQPMTQQVYTEEASYLTNYALQGVVREGTGQALGNTLGQSGIAGKTGSTNNLRDSWFVSYDSRHVVTVWLGRDDNQSVGLSGSRGALPVAAEYWQQAGVENMLMARPAGLIQGAFNKTTGAAVDLNCEGALLLPVRHYEPGRDIDCEGEIKESPEEDEKSWFKRIFG
ncbi:penicillin-binding protein 1B [Aliidiomarina minuta]|uniref:Penicillin-binding protein 1B n=1 Tax=Aliidiomarina minuta TaxID=880057 RepID=A0A432W471_9GAMM|nr:penicillin-binding protein 1B [Aliidiomarina minuta]RUO24288.1 penicillin-binding protein 1B [Aliidiomarina minuta]